MCCKLRLFQFLLLFYCYSIAILLLFYCYCSWRIALWAPRSLWDGGVPWCWARQVRESLRTELSNRCRQSLCFWSWKSWCWNKVCAKTNATCIKHINYMKQTYQTYQTNIKQISNTCLKVLAVWSMESMDTARAFRIPSLVIENGTAFVAPTRHALQASRQNSPQVWQSSLGAPESRGWKHDDFTEISQRFHRDFTQTQDPRYDRRVQQKWEKYRKVTKKLALQNIRT